MVFRPAVLIIAVLMVATPAPPTLGAANDQRVEVGFLEDAGGGSAPRDTGRVRLAFIHEAGGWKAFDAGVVDEEALGRAAGRFAGSRRWVASRKGKSLGVVDSKDIPEYAHYDDVGTQSLVGPLPSFARGRSSMRYAGWPGEPVFDPLTLVSRTPCPDPADWLGARTRIGVTTEMVAEIRALQRAEFETDSCSARELDPADLKVEEVLTSKRGESLVALKTRRGSTGCFGPEDPEERYWFVVSADRQSSLLGAGLVLLDISDLDCDGEPEVIFWVDGYNLNGYRLYTTGSWSHVEFTWSYH